MTRNGTKNATRKGILKFLLLVSVLVFCSSFVYLWVKYRKTVPNDQQKTFKDKTSKAIEKNKSSALNSMPNLSFWFEGTDTKDILITKDFSSLIQWRTRKSEGKNSLQEMILINQIETQKQPIYHKTRFNGSSCISFEGGKWMEIDKISAQKILGSQNSYTIFANFIPTFEINHTIFSWVLAENNKINYSFGVNSATNEGVITINNVASKFKIAKPIKKDANFLVFNLNPNAGYATVILNGSEAVKVKVNTNKDLADNFDKEGTFTIGKSPAFPSAFEGCLADLVIIKSSLTNSQLSDVVEFINAKYK